MIGHDIGRKEGEIGSAQDDPTWLNERIKGGRQRKNVQWEEGFML